MRHWIAVVATCCVVAVVACAPVPGGGTTTTTEPTTTEPTTTEPTTTEPTTSSTTTVPPAPSTSWATGLWHSCALIPGGTLKCWGDNRYGQLGNGSTTASSRGTTVQGGATFARVAQSDSYTSCAVTTAGRAKCWGRNDENQVGDGSGLHRTTPVEVPGLADVLDVSVGTSHVCALLQDRTVSCWGADTFGNLGIGGASVLYSPPTTVPGLSGVVAIDAGDAHTCAVTMVGELHCWGRNSDGELGDGTTVDRSSPVRVEGVDDVVDLAVSSGRHVCAIEASGTTKCWGNRASGQIGNGAGPDQLVPQEVPELEGALDVATGNVHTCGVLGDGLVRCVGNNQAGQLGDGTRTNRSTWTPVLGLTGVTSIAATWNHTCASTEGDRYCWGYNTPGHLGIGSTSPSLLLQPTLVTVTGSTTPPTTTTPPPTTTTPPPTTTAPPSGDHVPVQMSCRWRWEQDPDVVAPYSTGFTTDAPDAVEAGTEFQVMLTPDSVYLLDEPPGLAGLPVGPSNTNDLVYRFSVPPGLQIISTSVSYLPAFNQPRVTRPDPATIVLTMPGNHSQAGVVPPTVGITLLASGEPNTRQDLRLSGATYDEPSVSWGLRTLFWGLTLTGSVACVGSGDDVIDSIQIL